VDYQQPWGLGRALRRGALRYGSKIHDRYGKISHQAEPGHPETIFRVRMPGLKPQMTYYYWVSSVEANGKNDGEKSAINQFTMPAPGKRIVVDSP
jgi:hypothetical protein